MPNNPFKSKRRDNKIVTKKLFVPIRISTIAKGFEKKNFVHDINTILRERDAFILTDGQILKHRIEIGDIVDYQLEEALDSKLEGLVSTGLVAGLINREARQISNLEKIQWSDNQKMYFGIESPYQVSEDPSDFGYSWALVDTHKPYLETSERIIGLLHGQKDNRAFTCSGYHDEIVYTNKNRVVCMSCGALHCVLKNPLEGVFKHPLTQQEWFEFVDEDGTKREEEINTDIIDFLDVENTPKIWATHYWEEAVNEFIFFTRATQKELEDHYKCSGSIEDLIQAGWTEVPTSPFLAFQLSGTNLSIDKLSSALTSLNEGILSYKKAKNEIDFIKHGVLQLFHTIELILKSKLEDLDSLALKSKPDNPTVMKLLQNHGVSFSADEHQTIKELRKLRNSFPARRS